MPAMSKVMDSKDSRHKPRLARPVPWRKIGVPLRANLVPDKMETFLFQLREAVMDFVIFFIGLAAVAVALLIIKYTSPNPPHRHA